MILTDKLRKVFSVWILKISKILMRLGFSANIITIFGFLGNVLAAGFISHGYFIAGGIIAGVNCLFDAIDGTIAKESNGVSKYGSFLDSTFDRYSEFVLYLGLAFHYYFTDESLPILITFLAFGGSILVSYIRAKGESLGIMVKRGLLTRVERLVILIGFLLLQRPIYGLWIIAVLGHITAIQRFFIARNLLNRKGYEKND